MKVVTIISFLLFYSNLFSQSLIGIGGGVGQMSFNNKGNAVASSELKQNNNYVPKINISFCGIKKEKSHEWND